MLNTASWVSQSAVDLDAKFASSLAGNKYSSTLTNLNFQRNSTTLSDVWSALSAGDDAGGSVNGPNGVFTSSVINFDFENSAHRYLELRAHQGSAGTDGSLMDLRFDSLSIDVVDPIPEPSTAMLGVLGSLLLFRRRR